MAWTTTLLVATSPFSGVLRHRSPDVLPRHTVVGAGHPGLLRGAPQAFGLERRGARRRDRRTALQPLLGAVLRGGGRPPDGVGGAVRTPCPQLPRGLLATAVGACAFARGFRPSYSSFVTPARPGPPRRTSRPSSTPSPSSPAATRTPDGRWPHLRVPGPARHRRLGVGWPAGPCSTCGRGLAFAALRWRRPGHWSSRCSPASWRGARSRTATPPSSSCRACLWSPTASRRWLIHGSGSA